MKIRHATIGAARLCSVPTPRGDRTEVHLFTVCGLWVTSERCEEDLRATCENCKDRLRRAKGAPCV